MSQRTFEIEKRELGNGWVELRVVTLRPTRTPDFHEQGFAARKRIAELFLSGAAGIAASLGFPEVNKLLADLWVEAQAALS